MGEFAPILTKVQVEARVIDCLKDWISLILKDIEVDNGIAAGHIGRPRTWQADIDIRKLPERQVPAIVCVVGEGSPTDDGQYVHMTWPLVVGFITKGKNRQEGRDIAGYYGSAIAATCLWKLTSYNINSVMLEGITFGEQEGDPGVVGADVSVAFSVMTPAVVDRFGGPSPSLAPPQVPPQVPSWPDIPNDPSVADADYNPAVTTTPVPDPEPFEED